MPFDENGLRTGQGLIDRSCHPMGRRPQAHQANASQSADSEQLGLAADLDCLAQTQIRHPEQPLEL